MPAEQLNVHATDQLNAALAGRYRIERELGAGGMATVYLAHDVKHDRKVAIKVLKPELAAVLGAERFVVEIKTTAALQHPHILPLFDSGTADGFLYYVMPYIQGETIRERLNRETQFGVEEAVRIAREVADALDYAHRHGVIHRDIKPENILLHDGRAMVMDFGIALAVSAAAGGRMTETGLSLGTPHYMSPEQATAEKEISPRSDVYSLASVLYEMLAGQPPHIGGSAQAVIMKIITEPAQPVNALRKTVPPNVVAALAKALEKLPADRFESAKAFADALANSAFATTAMTAIAPVGAARTRGIAWLAAALVVAGAAAGVVYGRRSASVTEPPLAQFVLELPDSMIAVNACCGPAQVLSPDGTTLVFVGVEGASTSLWRRSIGQLQAERIAGTEGASSPAYSPDSRWIAFFANGQLKKVPLGGGPVVPITPTGPVAGLSWMSNDTIVFSGNPGTDALWLVPAAGGKPARVPGLDSAAAFRYPTALPGNRHVLAQWRSLPIGALENSRVVTVELSTGRVDTVAVGVAGRYARGSLVIGTSDGTLFTQAFDLRTRHTTGPATALPIRVSISGTSLTEFAVSESGWLEYEASRTGGAFSQLTVVGGTRDSTIALPGGKSAYVAGMAVSPAGDRIMLRLAARGSSESDELWLLDIRAGTLTRFTVGGGSSPVWSPDGRSIAYRVPENPMGIRPGIYVRPVDQVTAPQLVLPQGFAAPNSWTPDGRTLYFTAAGPGGADIGAVTVGDTTARWIVKTEFSEREGQVSPDGRRLAYTSARAGRSDIYVQSTGADAAAVQVSISGGSHPRWSRDGRTIIYLEPPGRFVGVTLAAGSEFAVTSRATLSRMVNYATVSLDMAWDLMPDGKGLLYSDEGGGTNRRRIVMIQNWPALARQMAAKP